MVLSVVAYSVWLPGTYAIVFFLAYCNLFYSSRHLKISFSYFGLIISAGVLYGGIFTFCYWFYFAFIMCFFNLVGFCILMYCALQRELWLLAGLSEISLDSIFFLPIKPQTNKHTHALLLFLQFLFLVWANQFPMQKGQIKLTSVVELEKQN